VTAPWVSPPVAQGMMHDDGARHGWDMLEGVGNLDGEVVGKIEVLYIFLKGGVSEAMIGRPNSTYGDAKEKSLWRAGVRRYPVKNTDRWPPVLSVVGPLCGLDPSHIRGFMSTSVQVSGSVKGAT